MDWLGASLTWGTHGTRMHYGKKASKGRQCDALANVLLGPTIHVDVVWTCTTYLNTFTLSWKQYSLMAAASFSRIMLSATKQQWLQLTGLKGSAAKILGPDTTGVQASTGQDCFGDKRGADTI